MRASFRSDTRGAALIEAALIMPVLLVVVFGIADLALFLWQQNSAGKAVQLGARKAIVSAAVAAGPGLSPQESQTYWNDLSLGQRCARRADGSSACPVFSVTCSVTLRCVCSTGRCEFSFDRERLAPIAAAMRAVLPQLKVDAIEISYATNGLGYVGRPVPVPVDVTVRLVGLRYDLMFLGGFGTLSLPIRASATLPGEAMGRVDDE